MLLGISPERICSLSLSLSLTLSLGAISVSNLRPIRGSKEAEVDGPALVPVEEILVPHGRAEAQAELGASRRMEPRSEGPILPHGKTQTRF